MARITKIRHRGRPPRLRDLALVPDRVLRHRALGEMADHFDAHADELGALVTKENDKILAQGMFESTTAGGTLRHKRLMP
jgi:hypothetical protein